MASIVNPYFPKGTATEQALFAGLKTEAIQVMGREYLYIPRHVVHENIMLGEDIISKFPLVIPLEMYMNDVQGFEGDKEMFSKFGLQIQNSYKLSVSQSRWEAEVKQLFDGVTGVGNAEAPFDVINFKRPQEGDLIYDPLTKFLMEIKFCDHDQEFYQIGKNYIYTLTCEAFNYGAEEFSTGNSDIDSFNELSTDILSWQILQESGDLLLQEDCDYSILHEVAGVEDNSFTQKEYGEDFNDSESTVVENPFGVFA